VFYLSWGGDGLLRVFPILIDFCRFGFILIFIKFVGGFLVSLICIRQTDLKSLIYYSSVAHIGIVIGGVMTIRYWGFCGIVVFGIPYKYYKSITTHLSSQN
jgi:NADH-ubiquinone oxidoreductase chain 4